MSFDNQLSKIIFKKQHKRLLDESLLDVRQKNAKNLSDEEFKKLMSYDPIISQLPSLDDASMANANESFSRWLLKMHKLGELQNKEPQLIQKLLSDFERAKKRRNLLPNNDINSYKSIDDLQNALDNIYKNLTTNQKNKDARKAQSEFKKELKPGLYLNGGAELLYTNNDWEVWTPHTYEGSKALRHGAVWCTGGDTPGFYNSYTEEGQLFVIINKNDKSEKYQLFVPFKDYDNRHEREFRDKNNDTVKFRDFIHENDLVDFFMTQDNVTNSFEDLDNPDIDDEWDDEKENEVAYEYDLGYDDYTGEICMYIDYSDLLVSSYYTDADDYRDMASTGYIEGINGDYKQYMEDILMEDGFINEVDWEETDLKVLYEFFKYETKLTQYSFEQFLQTLFHGAVHYDEGIIPEIENWFDEKGGMWGSQVRKCISSAYLDRPYADFIYNALRNIGWDVPQDNNRWNSYSRSQSYMDQFKNSFKYNFDDCHTIQEFWEEYTDRGAKSKSDIIYNNDIEIREDKGDIDVADCDWYEYSSDQARYDAKEIVEIFMSIKEWNEFISMTDDKEEDTSDIDDDKINVTIKNNYYIFHDNNALFYVDKETIERMKDYYIRNNKFESWGTTSEIIRNQIANYPTSYIKKILLKYGDLTDDLKRPVEILSDDEKFNEKYLFNHLYTFVENTLKNYIEKSVNENNISESLFSPDW